MIDTITNIWLITISFLGSIWLIYLYIRIILAEKESNKINEEIEKEQEKLKNREKDLLNSWEFEDKDKKIFIIEKSIQKLERQKKNVLEKIELFKIFKK